uniref:Uncharacterized protein n=1 Tax=Rhizophora mucronata TaxID=61149 RepID=A0A2P2L5Y5_RHIMU
MKPYTLLIYLAWAYRITFFLYMPNVVIQVCVTITHKN